MTTTLLIIARAFHYGSGMILVGVVAFRWLILLPAFGGETDDSWQSLEPFFRRLNQWFLWSGSVLVISGLALFWAVSAGMSDTSLADSLNAETLGTVFFLTQFGSVSQWRLGLAALLAILTWRLALAQWQTRRSRSKLEIGAALAATALMISFALTGHAAASGGSEFAWRITADGLHLLVTAIWPTGLLPFALFLAEASRIEKDSLRGSTLKVVGRFSIVSLISVAILITTGTINSYFLVGSFQALFTTTYGQTLCVKLSLFGTMLAVASWNRYHILPLLLTRTDAPDKGPVISLLRQLHGFVLAELGLAIAVVAVVSFLGTTPPAR
jgi:putative copper resistance protein D